MTTAEINRRTGLVATSQLSEVHSILRGVSRNIDTKLYFTREELGALREELTSAVARVNAIERMMVGVPPPKSGE